MVFFLFFLPKLMKYMDTPDTDLEGLRIQSESGARMGYTGKQVIHPGQIEIVQNAFLPSVERIEWANGLLTAFKEHQTNGKVTERSNIYNITIRYFTNRNSMKLINYNFWP